MRRKINKKISYVRTYLIKVEKMESRKVETEGGVSAFLLPSSPTLLLRKAKKGSHHDFLFPICITYALC
jgi:hypothetical protein